MLSCLEIHNFILIDHLRAEFGPGLNVLTGETGSGKSILLEALDIALGGRVQRRRWPAGRDQALIEATFDLPATLGDTLAAVGVTLSSDSQLVCQREVGFKGERWRSRCRLNGQTITQEQMHALGQVLLNVTTQHQGTLWTDPDAQRDVLDRWGGTAIQTHRQQVNTWYSQWQQAQVALQVLQTTQATQAAQQALWAYQLAELNQADLQDGDELHALTQTWQRLSHGVELRQQSQTVYQWLYDSDDERPAATDILGQALSQLEAMGALDDSVQPVVDLVRSALAQVEEAGRAIYRYGEDLETDPDALEAVEQRLRTLKALCRKYNSDLAGLIALREQRQIELEQLDAGPQHLEHLQAQRDQCAAALEQACHDLRQARAAAGRALVAQLQPLVRHLGMPQAVVDVALVPTAPGPQGSERVVFQFSANQGHPPLALGEVASGGERNRLLLALQACISQAVSTPTLIFDEIDTGISGAVAQTVAEALYRLARHHQVLCITHQPLVAAMADRHLRVEKHTQAAGRGIGVVTLDWEARQQELALLAGGIGTSEAVPFATALLAQATQLRAQLAG